MTEATQKRGKLKIFFGAFPGAGKTNAMLTAARRIRDDGRDVVVGLVDTHESAELALLEGFETLPALPHAELDLDAAIKRRPEVLLIDELAHANPPGARHPKRWNDVDELLAKGIDVFTTMGVQHLESLNDVVGEICGINEPETVPDTFFDTADETVMVDMSADELLVRLRKGKVHIRDVEKPQLGTFFSTGSLLALREIALRRTADVVEDEVRKYRADKAVEAVWKTHEHLLCCVGPEAGSEHVVRSAARLANHLDAEWTAVYVETPRLQRLPPQERGRILKVVSLAQELGARTAILTGARPSEAISEYARDQNISTVVVGRSSPRPLRVKRTMSDAIAAANDSLDVIEIGRRGAESGVSVTAPPAGPDEPNPRSGEKRARYVWTLLASAAAALFAGAVPAFELATIAMLFMLTTVLVGVRWGRGPAIVSAFVNVLAFDFFFVPPRFSFIPTDMQYLITFAVMLAVGVFIGQLAGNLRFQARVASYREKRARTLYEFARDLAQLRSTTQVIETTEEFMARQFRARVAVLVPDSTGTLVSPTGRGLTNPFDSTTAQWAYDQAQQAGAGTNTLAANEYLFLPLKSPTRTRGVLAVRPERARDLFIPEQRHQFEIFATLVATALERVHYVEVARDALLMARLQSGEMELELERRALADIVESALKTLGPTIAKHPVTNNVSRDLPAVTADPMLLERVFLALIGNAAKHTPAGTHVTVSAKAAADEIEVSVEDDGPGLPDGREEEVFESFTRGDKQSSPAWASPSCGPSSKRTAARSARFAVPARVRASSLRCRCAQGTRRRRPAARSGIGSGVEARAADDGVDRAGLRRVERDVHADRERVVGHEHPLGLEIAPLAVGARVGARRAAVGAGDAVLAEIAAREPGDAVLRDADIAVAVGADHELGVGAARAVVLRRRAAGAALEVGAVPAAVDERRRARARRAVERVLLRVCGKVRRREHCGREPEALMRRFDGQFRITLDRAVNQSGRRECARFTPGLAAPLIRTG
jgi:two-component system sensor histidine kinase KdpD